MKKLKKIQKCRNLSKSLGCRPFHFLLISCFYKFLSFCVIGKILWPRDLSVRKLSVSYYFSSFCSMVFDHGRLTLRHFLLLAKRAQSLQSHGRKGPVTLNLPTCVWAFPRKVPSPHAIPQAVASKTEGHFLLFSPDFIYTRNFLHCGPTVKLLFFFSLSQTAKSFALFVCCFLPNANSFLWRGKFSSVCDKKEEKKLALDLFDEINWVQFQAGNSASAIKKEKSPLLPGTGENLYKQEGAHILNHAYGSFQKPIYKRVWLCIILKNYGYKSFS